MQEKQMTAEFYAMHVFNSEDFSVLFKLLSDNNNGHAPSIALEKNKDKSDSDEKYQIRSISSNSAGTVFMAVFGRCRYNENLEQASAESEDKEVKLLPGYGLVEKNHFLFFKENNLIVYQKNGNGSNIAKLQRYLTMVTEKNIALEAVLKEDSYTKLLESGPLKKIEISIVPPPFAEIEEEHWLYEAIDAFKSDNAKRIKLVLSAEKDKTLSEHYKTKLTDLTRAGWTKIARATVKEEDKSDASKIKDEIIDLILNRVKKDFSVPVGENKKIDPKDIWRGLAGAKDECNSQLKTYFTQSKVVD